jgi:hypothetical protein
MGYPSASDVYGEGDDQGFGRVGFGRDLDLVAPGGAAPEAKANLRSLLLFLAYDDVANDRLRRSSGDRGAVEVRGEVDRAQQRFILVLSDVQRGAAWAWRLRSDCEDTRARRRPGRRARGSRTATGARAPTTRI